MVKPYWGRRLVENMKRGRRRKRRKRRHGKVEVYS